MVKAWPFPLAASDLCQGTELHTGSQRETVPPLCVHTCQGPEEAGAPAGTGRPGCLTGKQACLWEREKAVPWKLSSGEQHKKTPTHGLCASHNTHTHIHTHDGGAGAGSGPLHPPHCPCCHPRTLLCRDSFPGGSGGQEPPTHKERRLGDLHGGREWGAERPGARASEGQS